MCHPINWQKSNEGKSLIEQVELQRAVPVQDIEMLVEVHFGGGWGWMRLHYSWFLQSQEPMPCRTEQRVLSPWIVSEHDRHVAVHRLMLMEVLHCILF